MLKEKKQNFKLLNFVTTKTKQQQFKLTPSSIALKVQHKKCRD